MYMVALLHIVHIVPDPHLYPRVNVRKAILIG